MLRNDHQQHFHTAVQENSTSGAVVSTRLVIVYVNSQRHLLHFKCTFSSAGVCTDGGDLGITTSLRGCHSSLVICRKCNNYILFFQPYSVDQLRVPEGIVALLEEFAFLSRSHWEAYYRSCVCLLNLKLHPGDSQSSLGRHKDWKLRKTASRVLTEGRKIDLPAHLKLAE